MPVELSYHLPNDRATVNIGRALARAIGPQGACVYLQGELGAGKTTLSRGIVQGFGHRGAVKSPTYTLVEPYELAEKSIYHFDLYRLSEAAELDFLGLDSYFSGAALCLIEWPERGAPFIPAADIQLLLTYTEDRQSADRESTATVDSRNLVCRAETALGSQILTALRPLAANEQLG